MPYIPDEQRRAELDITIYGEVEAAQTAGELNFQIARLCDDYLKRKGKTYDVLNAIDGVLGLTQFEFRRRLVGPYEDRKIEENGDVYESAKV